MIGRSDELEQLARALSRAQTGAATAVIISGEAGIGKTRLIHEFTIGPARQARVLRGGCIPLTDGLQPLAPIIDILRVLAPELGPQASLLNGLLPELGHVFEDVDQPRLFAALRQVLERVAASAPLVLVIEDLHWADPSTLALLAYLVHAMRSGMGRLLLIGSCRAELPDLHPLRALLIELDRSGSVRIELDRLALDQTAAQIAGILDAPADPVIAGSLHARCGGNPFLVEELLAVGPQTDPLPQGTRDILLQRVRPLDPDDRHLLLALALAGRRVDHDLLARVLGWASTTVLAHLRKAIEWHLLVALPDGYTFRHALVAEALISEALPHERIHLHRAYASVLGPVATAAEIAHHWCRAADPMRALVACVEAGLAAERLFAQSEARRHFDHAISLWDDAARLLSPLDLVELCLHGAEASYLEGDAGHAIDLIRRALLEAGNDGRLYERLGRYLWANGDAEAESIGAYERAVELSKGETDRARALTGLAGALTYADRPEAPVWCEQALRMARTAGAHREEGRALQTLGYCEAMAGQVERGLMHCREALAMAVKLDHSEDLYRAYSNLVGVLRMAGRTAEAATAGLEGAEVARRRGAERTYGNLLLGDAVDALILIGRWDEAEALLPDEPDVVAHGTPLIATNLWLSAAMLHTWRGHFDQSRVFLDACMAVYAKRGHGHVRSMLHAGMSELCLWQGDFAEASRWISLELDLLGHCDFTSLLGRLVFQGLRAEAGLTRPNDLTRLVNLLEDMSRRPDPPPDAAALIVTCSAELARVRGESDAETWDSAADQWIKLDMPWPLAYSRWRQAEILLTGRPGTARRQAGAAALIDAYTVAARIGATPMVDEIKALARRTRLASRLPTASPSATPMSKLTDREAEVLDLICAGATNRRIAQQLYISEKTVSVHVSSILAKLGAANRGEAAALKRQSD